MPQLPPEHGMEPDILTALLRPPAIPYSFTRYLVAMPNTASSLPGRLLAVSFLLALSFLFLSARADAQTLRMFSPNGGENWLVDSTYKIRWLVQGNVTGTLWVEYSVDSGSVWKLIDTVPARSGFDSLSWKVPADTGRYSFVRVRNADSLRATSRRTFRISFEPVAPPPTLRVLSPNGGEIYAVDSTIKIRWSAQNTSGGPVTVSLSIDSGRTWKPIGVGTASSLDSLMWKVTNDTTRQAMIRVRSDADSTLSDRSDRTFQIRTTFKPQIVLTVPNGGETLDADSTTWIRWNATDVTGLVQIDYSSDGGVNWTRVANRLGRSGPDSASWKVPTTATTQGLIRVMLGASTTGDTSDATFTIRGAVTPELQLIYPTAGGTFAVDSTITILWTSQGLTRDILVEYTTDNFRWKPIATVSGRTGLDSASWTIPDELTATGYVRVSTSDAALRSVSESPFAIVPSGPISSVGLDRVEAGGSAVLYPNPTAGPIELRWPQKSGGDVRVMVLGVDGRTVRAVELGRHEAGVRSTRLDLGDLPTGLYRVEIAAGSERQSTAVTVVR